MPGYGRGMALARIGTLEFTYADDGPADGPVVLLLHGFPQDHRSWDAVSAALVERGFRTIRPDQRGYSPGARPQAVDGYRLGVVAADAVALLDHLGVERAHVVGHDWGGMVAWAVAAAYPERLLTLTVLSTPHPAAFAASMRGTQALRSWYMGVIQVPRAAEALLRPGGRMWAGMMRGLPAEARIRYTAAAARPGALTAMLAWYRALPRDMARPSVRWRPIDVPTLYVWGRRDPALGESAARRTSRYVRGPFTFVILPNAGHWLPERAAAEVTPLLLAHLGSADATGPVGG